MKHFNQTLCKKLAKVADKSDNWDEFIESTLMAYCTTKHTTIGVTLFVLVYRHEAVLLIDETPSTTIRDCMLQIVEKVFHIREKAWLMI